IRLYVLVQSIHGSFIGVNILHSDFYLIPQMAFHFLCNFFSFFARRYSGNAEVTETEDRIKIPQMQIAIFPERFLATAGINV
ncbi:MAG: hypothetical protein AAF975_08525, partial [Spirochaetota bacterium]